MEELNEKFKARQKNDFDKQHHAKDLDAIANNCTVWITSGGDRVPGTLISPANSPRSYLVVTPSGTVRRNHIHLNVDPSSVNDHLQSLSRTLTLAALFLGLGLGL